MTLSLSRMVTGALVTPSNAGAVATLVVSNNVKVREPSFVRLSMMGTMKVALY